eukprot:scaffold706154_cov157-Attheya_sp.AAC.1
MLPNLGMQTQDVVQIDEAHLGSNAEFEDKARTEKMDREANGVGDRFAQMQPYSQPAVDFSL